MAALRSSLARAAGRLAGGSRACSSVVDARAGNFVRFLAADGAERWGMLSEGQPGAARRARTLAAGSSEPARLMDTASFTGEEVEIAKVLAPLPVDPAPAVVIIGLNYVSHAKETGQELPKFPVFAYKSPASVIGSGKSISIPSVARQKPEVDFEGELAIIIGKAVRDVSEQEALGAVLGVTGANDVSARRWQGKKGGGQWSRAKSFDTFCPLGPTIVPVGAGSGAAKALAPGGEGLRLQSIVNGEVMQDGNTSDMSFGVAALVSYLSQGTTLLPGTVILTGTPPGVGYVRKPPKYLAEGDKVDVILEGAGTLSTAVENGP